MANRPSGIPSAAVIQGGRKLAFLLAPKEYTVGRLDTTGNFTSNEESRLRQHIGEQCPYGAPTTPFDPNQTGDCAGRR